MDEVTKRIAALAEPANVENFSVDLFSRIMDYASRKLHLWKGRSEKVIAQCPDGLLGLILITATND